MKRDMDLIRDLLLKIEGGQSVFETLSSDMATAMGIESEGRPTEADANKLRMHLDMLEEAGLVTAIEKWGAGAYQIDRLSWDGFEFIEGLRDPSVWDKTKGAASKAGGAGFKMLIEIGKGVVKGELQKLGIPIS